MKPITSDGYRACLVFDLIKSNKRLSLSANELDTGKKNQETMKKQISEQLESLSNEINNQFTKLNKLIYVFDHHYQSFSQLLKSNESINDKTITNKILALKNSIGYSVYLAQFSYQEILSINGDFVKDDTSSVVSNFLDPNDLSPITLFGIDTHIDIDEILPINCLKNIEPKLTRDANSEDEIKTYTASSLVIIKNETLNIPPPLIQSSSCSENINPNKNKKTKTK
ncbi:expressed protein [Dictyostelium purpureum]|uniref:Expressed protein n=1 Tax=Dictyostelium purpureum TaxID=5786 RepID=F0ZR81_DICPU|nr:uncharacterized protein DICPUDRAFT_92386 [Dictyostelium purpureum]EGC33552.1 expressed protein [Dictyostelium purpureum]|eukprot:XP_003289934.1 expressed protein [Dictyostelium purpureum]